MRAHLLRQLLTAGITVATLMAPPAHAVLPDADAQEVSRYVLTDAGLAKYTTATQKLGTLAASVNSKCDDDDATSSSLSQIVAKADAAPGVKAAIQSAGMTTREYIVFSMSLLQVGIAAWVADQPGGAPPSGVSMDNVKFYRAHKAAVEKLGTGKSGGCD
jgi:hypothetical protein